MKKLYLIAVFAAILCSCGGCWLMREPASKQPEIYDLTQPAVQAAQSCRFGRIRNLSPAGRKMLYRHADNRITESDISWVQSPDALLFRYLESRFPAAQDAPQIRISLLRFELDLTASQAVIAVELASSAPGSTAEKIQRHIFKAPLTDRSGAAASRAMTICAEELSKTIITMIQEK